MAWIQKKIDNSAGVITFRERRSGSSGYDGFRNMYSYKLTWNGSVVSLQETAKQHRVNDYEVLEAKHHHTISNYKFNLEDLDETLIEIKEYTKNYKDNENQKVYRLYCKTKGNNKNITLFWKGHFTSGKWSTETTKESEFSIDFADKTIAERVSKALKHAILEARKKEPF